MVLSSSTLPLKSGMTSILHPNPPPSQDAGKLTHRNAAPLRTAHARRDSASVPHAPDSAFHHPSATRGGGPSSTKLPAHRNQAFANACQLFQLVPIRHRTTSLWHPFLFQRASCAPRRVLTGRCGRAQGCCPVCGAAGARDWVGWRSRNDVVVGRAMTGGKLRRCLSGVAGI